jgi:hypothetical protein
MGLCCSLLAGGFLNCYGFVVLPGEAANFAFLFIPFDFTEQLKKDE